MLKPRRRVKCSVVALPVEESEACAHDIAARRLVGSVILICAPESGVTRVRSASGSALCLALLKVDGCEISRSGVQYAGRCTLLFPSRANFRLRSTSEPAAARTFPIFVVFDPCCPAVTV